NGGIPDAYPISGFGLGRLLVALGVFHASDYFPFGVLQLMALAPIYWIAWRLRSMSPTLGRFSGFYTTAFIAFAFLARFFAHNYVATLVALACCIVPLAKPRPRPDLLSQPRHRVEPPPRFPADP